MVDSIRTTSNSTSNSTRPPPSPRNLATAMKAAQLMELGSQQYTLGQYKEAHHSFHQAVVLQRTAISTTSNMNLAATLQDLGSVAFQIGLSSEARAALEESLALKRRYYDDKNNKKQAKNLGDLANSVEELGRVCIAVDDIVAAKQLYNEALDLKRRAYGRGTPAVHAATEPLGSSTSASKELKEHNYDQKNSDLAHTINKLGEISHKLGRYHNARKKYAEALDMYRTSYGKNAAHLRIAKILCNLGHVSSDLGKQQDAKSYYDQAMEMANASVADSNNDKEHPILQDTLLVLFVPPPGTEDKNSNNKRKL